MRFYKSLKEIIPLSDSDSDSDVFRSEGLVHQWGVHGRFAGIHVNPPWFFERIAEDFRPHVVGPIDNMTGLVASRYPCFPRLQGNKWHCKTRLLDFSQKPFDLTLFDTEYLHVPPLSCTFYSILCCRVKLRITKQPSERQSRVKQLAHSPQRPVRVSSSFAGSL